MSEIIKAAEETVARATDERQRINRTSNQLSQEKESALARIEELKVALPMRHAAFHLGEVPAEEVEEIKAEIRRLTELVEEDIPQAFTGLNTRDLQALTRIRQERLILEDRDRFMRDIEKARAGDPLQLQRHGRTYAQKLGLQAELAEIEKELRASGVWK